MKVWIRTTILAAAAATMVAATSAQQRAESKLAGIKLYDSGVDVVKRFGSPTDVIAISFQTGGGGGGGDFGGGGGGPAAGRAGGGGGNVAPAGIDFIVPPVSFKQLPSKGGGGPAGPPPGNASGGGADMGGGGGGGGATTDTQYVRWVYRKGAGGSFNVVLNKFNKVVQIEAIGVSNPAVKTLRGVTLGSSMASVMQKYQTPDAYEVGGNYFMIRYLRSAKVAFRLTRENGKAPYRVTGIVVSAGKA